MTAEDVLSWWFGTWDDRAPLEDDDPELVRWWRKDARVDAQIREQFGPLHAEVVAGEHRDWAGHPRGLLALVIVTDQLSRVIYRGQGRAFACDTVARRLTDEALSQAWDRDLQLIERAFLYMPLMHAEDRVAHRRALSLFTGLAEEAEEAGLARADYYRRVVGFEQRHKEIIDRFGRYPHRNFQMERTSTPEELAFLQDVEQSF